MAKVEAAAAMEEERLGVKIERQVPEARLAELGVLSWPKWGCPPQKVPWTFKATERMYLVKGKVKVYVEDSLDYFEIGHGDMLTFPLGMSVTWDIVEAVEKHYSLVKDGKEERELEHST